jgi:hypothetical protein
VDQVWEQVYDQVWEQVWPGTRIRSSHYTMS